MNRFAAVVLLLSVSIFSFAQIKNANSFDAFVDSVFDQHLKDNPSHGTSLSFHQYDAKLEDYSLQQGAPPVKIVRKALLGDDSPTL